MKSLLFMRILLVGLVLSGASCSSKEARKPTFAVTGKVLINGKSAEHALVVFHPVGETGEGVLKPRGKVDASGNFKLTTYDADDGAPAGKYRVTVELWLRGQSPDDPPRNYLASKYSKPESSDLEATVGSSPTEIATIELKR
jgi:hypothetical protein